MSGVGDVVDGKWWSGRLHGECLSQYLNVVKLVPYFSPAVGKGWGMGSVEGRTASCSYRVELANPTFLELPK